MILVHSFCRGEHYIKRRVYRDGEGAVNITTENIQKDAEKTNQKPLSSATTLRNTGTEALVIDTTSATDVQPNTCCSVSSAAFDPLVSNSEHKLKSHAKRQVADTSRSAKSRKDNSDIIPPLGTGLVNARKTGGSRKTIQPKGLKEKRCVTDASNVPKVQQHTRRHGGKTLYSNAQNSDIDASKFPNIRQPRNRKRGNTRQSNAQKLSRQTSEEFYAETDRTQ